MNENHSLLKVFFITSKRAVSCADHYHVSVHATVTGMHLYDMCMYFIRSLELSVCVCVCVCVCLCLCVRYTVAGLEVSVVKHWLGDPVCFPMKRHFLLAVHLEKLSVNRPLTQKTGPLKTHTIGSGALDALIPLSPFHCAMTRTNCIHRPLHKNILGL